MGLKLDATVVPTHKHADGGMYESLDYPRMKLPDGTWVNSVLYRNMDNLLCVRTQESFNDRFVAVEVSREEEFFADAPSPAGAPPRKPSVEFVDKSGQLSAASQYLEAANYYAKKIINMNATDAEDTMKAVVAREALLVLAALAKRQEANVLV